VFWAASSESVQCIQPVLATIWSCVKVYLRADGAGSEGVVFLLASKQATRRCLRATCNRGQVNATAALAVRTYLHRCDPLPANLFLFPSLTNKKCLRVNLVLEFVYLSFSFFFLLSESRLQHLYCFSRMLRLTSPPFLHSQIPSKTVVLEVLRLRHQRPNPVETPGAATRSRVPPSIYWSRSMGGSILNRLHCAVSLQF